jgi:hypothetical protein
VSFFLGREMHPDDTDDGVVYLFFERPTKGLYGNGHYYFWTVKDPSNKVRLCAGDSHMLAAGRGKRKIRKGELFRLRRTIQ